MKKNVIKVDKESNSEDIQKALDKLGIKSSLKKAEEEAEEEDEEEDEDDEPKKADNGMDLIKGEVDGLKQSVAGLTERFAEVIDGLKKSPEGDDEPVGDTLRKADLEVLGESISKAIGEKLQAIGTISKHVLDRFDEIEKAVEDMTDTLEDIASQPLTRKSYDNLRTVEKSFGNDGGEGGRRILKSKTDREAILKLFDGMEASLMKAGRERDSDMWKQAAITFETSGFISENVVKAVQEDANVLIVGE